MTYSFTNVFSVQILKNYRPYLPSSVTVMYHK